jgi:hypothetical protein
LESVRRDNDYETEVPDKVFVRLIVEIKTDAQLKVLVFLIDAESDFHLERILKLRTHAGKR